MRLVLTILGLLAAGALVIHLAGALNGGTVTAAPGMDEVVKRDAAPVAQSPAASLVRPRSSNGEEKSTADPFNRIMTAPEGLAVAFRKLEAMQGHPDAKYYMHLIALHCAGHRAENGNAISKHIRQQSTGERREQRLAALESRVKACEGVSFVDLSRLLDEAAEAGSSKAIATKLVLFPAPKSFEEIDAMGDRAKELAATRDGEVLSLIGTHFYNLNRSFFWKLPGIEGEVSGREIGDAMNLAACDFGDDCRAESSREQMNCYRGGLCGLDRVSRYQQEVYSPSGFERLNQIRQIISTGIRHNQWPEGFWHGTRKQG